MEIFELLVWVSGGNKVEFVFDLVSLSLAFLGILFSNVFSFCGTVTEFDLRDELGFS